MPASMITCGAGDDVLVRQIEPGLAASPAMFYSGEM
jgi:hypothetical protein